MDTNTDNQEWGISVIICTYNRARLLEENLESLLLQEYPLQKFEVVIIDNASSDDTRTVAMKWNARYPQFRYVYESKQGLSYARNRGIVEARSKIIAYIDDDAIAEPQWLSSLVEAYQTLEVAVAVGGPIKLKWRGERPLWLHDDLLHMLGYTDYGDQGINVKHISGGNMSFTAETLKRYGGFDVRLGRKGNIQLTAEESDLQWYLRRDGHPIYYHPRAIVWHQIESDRMRPEYLLRRFRGQGRTQAYLLLLVKWPGRYEVLKLMIRQLVRQRKTILNSWRYVGHWLTSRQDYVPATDYECLIRCMIEELLAFEQQMLELLLGGRKAYDKLLGQNLDGGARPANIPQ